MRGKVLRLSPNEEAQLLREEQDRRRKARLRQVREQERFIARQVRRQVQERRQQQLQTLADSLQLEWKQQQTLRIQALSSHYQLSLSSLGHGHRSAQENEPDVEALAQRSVERQERAEERHREALRELGVRRHEEEQQQRRPIEARRKALLEEKRRAERVASLPPPPPDPVESIGRKTPRPLRPAAAERFSLTHDHMTAVARESDAEQQLSAPQAAALEGRRLEELQREEARERRWRLDRARLRGSQALRREQHTQDRARLLCELERLQQAHLLRRRQTVSSVPPQVFQPLCRQQELRDEQQRELEIAFQDAYTEERKVKGDLVLQLVPDPLPPPSAASHDEELDVTLDPECAPEGEEPETPIAETPASPRADGSRRALSRLLERIRRQRDRRTGQLTTETPGTSHDADAQEEASSVETGSLSSQEKESGVSLEEQTPSTTHTEDAPDVSDEAVVAGSLPALEDRVHLLPESERRADTDQPDPVSQTSLSAEALWRQQQEQLALLEELEQKRRELEQRWRDCQLSTEVSSPDAKDEVSLDVTHTQRLHQYQQRLLEQNRLHKKCVEEARRRLEEYQHTLRLRQAMGSTSAPLVLCAGKPPDSQLPSRSAQTQPLLSPPDSSGSGQGDQELPLPPPAVVLELLCSQKSDAESSGSALQRETADRQGPASCSTDVQTHQMILNTLLNAMEEASDPVEPRPAPSQRDGVLIPTAVLSDAPVHRGRVKPPVSRPPARLAFLRQMEQHELSAIQEVDSPVNISLDTELQSADVSESSSASLPAVSSEDGHSAGQRSQVTGRISRMSWRETLLCDSSASASPSGVNHLRERPAADPDYLSSTTISTGSYSTSDHEPSCVVSDASHLSLEPDVCSPSPRPSSCHMTSDPQVTRDSVQQIIDRYGAELNASLRHTGESAAEPRGAAQSWSSVLQEETSATTLSSTEHSGVFQPLQPHPDIDSSSSSSSRDVLGGDGSTRVQGWSETVHRILERLSHQLSLSAPSLHDQDTRQAASFSARQHRSGESTLSRAEDQSESGEASDMSRSQGFDESSIVADGPEEDPQSTAVGTALFFSPVRSSVQPSLMTTDDALTDAPRDDASGVFLPLPSDLTTNESADCSAALCVPLEAEVCESPDQSLQRLRADEPGISTDLLSLTHESLWAPLTADESLAPQEGPELLRRAQVQSHLINSHPVSGPVSHCGCVSGQGPGDLKGILEESIISFISLPESTLQDPEASRSQTPDTGSAAQEVEAEDQSESFTVEDDSQSEQPEAPVTGGTVMLLEFQSSSARQCQLRRDRLAQRSALRAAQIRARRPEPGRTTPVQRASRASGHTEPKPHTGAGVRICSEEHRRCEEAEMYRRTHRLYNQLEEVKQKKELQSRQESYAKNREKARDFQRKTLEKLRSKLNR
ncbi:centrosomal protein of 295 kDa isoform X3 [Puntigrus tetrazona]|uniref:centrosomal protein of 295 kDa isoform X3 n=1 Tax=Puntigrus tetrazona TaxID=1606681 RepID=UPI001C891106|nr:centrosomal protein of 295 kDa isoform X3 [Puntigrus tetrazona]